MRIAVNNFPQADGLTTIYQDYITQLFNQLRIQQPGAELVLVNEKKERVWRSQPALWVKRHTDASLRTVIPQLLIADQLLTRGSLFRKWLLPLKLRRAKKIIVLSAFVKARLEVLYHLPAENIVVIPAAADQRFQALGWQEKEAVKKGYMEGCEYFLVTGGQYDITCLLNLLKAFSRFKKWQRSNMKLVITDIVAQQQAAFEEKLGTYKYRNDVILQGAVPTEKLTDLVGAAYALVHTAAPEASPMIMLNAMQSEVPVIAADNNSLPETGAEAVFYANPNDPDAIGKHMLALYRDENLRGSYIKKGKERAGQFHWKANATLLWQQIIELGVRSEESGV